MFWIKLQPRTVTHFLEFIKDVKMCIVNGGVIPEVDNFTCFNRNGCSIVDYILLPTMIFSISVTNVKFSQCKKL